MQFSEALRDVTTLATSGPDVEVRGIEYDSRRVHAGDIFLAMRGETTDGNTHIAAAIERGAAAIVTDSPAAFKALNPATPAALIDKGRRALAGISATIFGKPHHHLALAGVTGTNGKTTTAFLLEAMLRHAARKCVLIGTIEYHVADEVRPSPHTTPESRDVFELFAQGISAGATEAVMEMSSHALEQERVWGLACDVAIFTNLTQDHLDYHRTMDAYFAAKRRLFEGVGCIPPRVAVINADDHYAAQLIAAAKHSQVITYGLNSADWRATDVELHAGRTTFALQTPHGTARIASNLSGRVNVYNLLAAAAAAHARGITLEQIAAGAAALACVPGRFQTVDCGQPFTVVVDYAHTDDALRNLTTLARELVAPHQGRVITVFGCGGDRDAAKRPRMGRAAGEGSDIVILTSDNPRSEDPHRIIDEALAGLKETHAQHIIEPDRAAAIATALNTARNGDIVLIAGKGHEKVQILRGGTIPFDDAAIATEILTRKPTGHS